MRNDLKDQRIIITRLQKQAEIWAAQLQALGASTDIVPVLELEPVADVDQIQAIKNVVLDFDLYQKAIFVSQNAVDFALTWLENFWPQLPQGIQYFAVGETTARQLHNLGLPVTALGAALTGSMNSESLLQAPELQQVAGEKIVIFRGCGGRGKMAEVLRERGANVAYCELYTRTIPAQAADQLRTVLESAESWVTPPVIALHSGESLQHLLHVLAKVQNNDRNFFSMDRLLDLRVLVPGQRVADIARSAGFTQIMVAENATDQAMTSALLHHELPAT
jgi:uroporphyrinogen-III synthase